MKRWLPRGAGLALIVALCAGAAGAQPRAGATQAVTIEGVQFHPSELTLHRGDRIVWTNKDPFPHTVTADTKLFDSHSIAPGASWSYVAKRPGEYAYSCTLHPTMKGKIIVK